MSHNIETMVYTNQVPWHGLGHYVADAPSVADMLTLAKLDWTVERQPMHLANGVEVPDFAALVRSSDSSVLDVVGSRYTPIQNHEAFEFFKEFVEAGDATMETAGSLRGGRYVWGLANLKSSFKLKGKDEVKGYVLVACPHEAGKSFIVKFTTVRVVCNNTLTLALKADGNEFRMHHRRAFDATAIERAKTTLGIAREQMQQFEETARTLKSKTMTRDDVIRILAPVYQPDAKVAELVKDFDDLATPRLKQLLDINERAPGADPTTAWGVLNAVTYYSDHIASRTGDKRLTNAWFGKTAVHKERVLDTLLAA